MAEVNPLAGKPAEPSMLTNVPRLVTAYFVGKPDPALPAQRVSFGTSGHRGSAFNNAFNEQHILAISQALCDHRRASGITGPMFVGIDTHALAEPALASALEVFAANDVEVMIDANDGYTPTPVISHAILTNNNGRSSGRADGVVITPSHNPPEDGGFKYNPPDGGPADTDITSGIERAANRFLEDGLRGVKRIPYERARKSSSVHRHDYIGPYVADLAEVIDMDAIRDSGVTIGIDPLGGAAVRYWQPIIDRYGLAATIVSDERRSDLPLHDRGLGRQDPDGLLLALCDGAVDRTARQVRCRLCQRHRRRPARNRDPLQRTDESQPLPCRRDLPICSSTARNGAGEARSARPSSAARSSTVSPRSSDASWSKTPVGFKWFVGGLRDGSFGFAGEESAGASFLRRNGTVWTTDKDGIILGLLAAEMTARTKSDPSQLFNQLTSELGVPFYERIDAPATSAQKNLLKALSPEKLGLSELAGEPVRAALTAAPGNGQSFGGIKVITDHGWFAARPSGTEEVYKIYAESFRSQAHLRQIQQDAQSSIDRAFKK